jgi:MFS family permease
VLDRFDRKKVMIASDLFRAVIAACFVLTIHRHDTWLLYLLSALLMGASPFFSAGRAAILPSIASKDELHTANSLTQTTQWTTLSVGAFLGGMLANVSFELAFVFNAASFLISAICISRLHLPGRGFRPVRAHTEAEVVRPWHEYKEGLAYMRSRPLILGIGGIALGWATGGGAAQILFSIFGEIVFDRGPGGIGIIWGCAGIGLIFGSFIAYRLGKVLSFDGY